MRTVRQFRTPGRSIAIAERRKIAACRKKCSEERSHSSLGYKTPKQFPVAQAQSLFRAELEAQDSTPSLEPGAPHPGSNRRGYTQIPLYYFVNKATDKSLML